MNNQEEDLRGMDLRADNFKNQLLMLVNNCGLNISTAYYIVKDMCNTLEKGFEDAAETQYRDFCDKANAESAAKTAIKEADAASPQQSIEEDKAE